MTEGATPTPAQPSEGAVFIRLRDLPEGWEWRAYDRPENAGWVEGGHLGSFTHYLVEARPKPEPLVAVWLTRSDVEHVDRHASRDTLCPSCQRFHGAARAALEAEDQAR